MASASRNCDTGNMNGKGPLTLIEGGKADGLPDLTGILDDLPVDQAIAQLRAISRQRSAAANSPLAIVGPGFEANRPADRAARSSLEPG